MQLIFSATIENTLSGKISDTYNPFFREKYAK